MKSTADSLKRDCHASRLAKLTQASSRVWRNTSRQAIAEVGSRIVDDGGGDLIITYRVAPRGYPVATLRYGDDDIRSRFDGQVINDGGGVQRALCVFFPSGISRPVQIACEALHRLFR